MKATLQDSVHVIEPPSMLALPSMREIAPEDLRGGSRAPSRERVAVLEADTRGTLL